MTGCMKFDGNSPVVAKVGHCYRPTAYQVFFLYKEQHQHISNLKCTNIS